MATPTKDGSTCPRCGRKARLYYFKGSWLCGKCGRKIDSLRKK